MANLSKAHGLLGTARNTMKVFKTLTAGNSQVELATSNQTAITDFSLTNSNVQEINDNYLELRLFAETQASGAKCIGEIYLYPNTVQAAASNAAKINAYGGTKYCHFEATFTSGVMHRHPITLVSATNYGVCKTWDITSCDGFALWTPSVLSNTVGNEAPFTFDMRGYAAFDVRLTDINSTAGGAQNTGVVVGWRSF